MKEMKMTKIMLCSMGVVMFVLGSLTLSIPTLALTTLSLIFGFGFVVSGIFCLISFFSEKDILSNPAWVLIQAFLDIFIGIFLLWNLGPTAVAVTYIVAFWILFGGIAKFSAAFMLRKTGADKWWIVLINGVLGILTAFIMMFFPFAGSAVLVAIIGIFLALYGILIFLESSTIKIFELKKTDKISA
ncbi:MAG: DUF308 domain-containing protein [Endomicrobium sp.]|jgi:uncharacterized membrane protein HdeD (DUF308 family)|nr:DUF308 domain-containing protein [Endomicrobium sp.]